MLSVVAFSFALLLGNGNVLGFSAICFLSGLALGADLALPPAMLAETIRAKGDESRAGAYFGLWTLATKLNLALAAGVALPLLALFGYVPGEPETVRPLYFAYCVLPCALKLCAAYMLRSHFTLRNAQEGFPA
jgi:Na+/melibiose symporter-like transporter